MHYWSYGPGFYGDGFGFNIFSLILTAVFWFLIIFLIFKLIKSAHHHYDEHEPMTNGDNSLGIVRERYAKGEINKKEFEQLIKDLS